MFDITAEIYANANKAREHLEAIHWPDGPICPTCGNVDPSRITKLAGKSTRPGVYKCKECRKPFSVTVGTVFERSHNERAADLLRGARDKRLSYRRIGEAENA